ncbi:SpoIIE family protein phosphatase [Streptomyces sp. ACA25]|uniref:PP2C family protein-serine/threonine phosphatase n=1 Tax=Streptomyces sp. ACA25 TaxID=3022596 RepID=UPI00230799D0|nr:SpoIIE family protein phosphatase [Streptomyces sp. ACA25]MDB1089221.1 SpoIIE family protein phosphatase [Streptomyces sp. ACA25]
MKRSERQETWGTGGPWAGPEVPVGRPAPGAVSASGVPSAVLDLIDEAVIACDGQGLVHGLNRRAAELFPRLRTGGALSTPAAGPLAQASQAGAGSFDSEHEGRSLVGTRAELDGLSVWLVRDETARRSRERAVQTEWSNSLFLAEADRRLTGSLHHGRTVRTLVRTAVPVLADGAVLLLPQRHQRSTWYRVWPGASGAGETGLVPAESLDRMPRVADAYTGREARVMACPRQDLDELRVLGAVLAPEMAAGEGHALVVGLPGSGYPAGALVLVRGPERDGFGPADTELVRQFASRAGIALAAADFYSQQAHTTAVLRAGLDPDPLPAVDAVRLGAAYRPAREALQIGGDYYQARACHDGGVEFFLGDVRGKGVEAAVLTGRVRQTLHALTLVEPRPVRVLELLNQVLLDAGETRFTTLVTGRALPAPGGGLDVTVAGGGHPSPLVLRQDGRVEPVDIGGMLVGALPDPDFDQERLHLGPGELLLLYSDGVTEARGGPSGNEMYGDDRLARDLATCAGMPAGAVAERVELLTTQWLAGGAYDDIAVLAVQAAAMPAPPSPPRSTPPAVPERPGGTSGAGPAGEVLP